MNWIWKWYWVKDNVKKLTRTLPLRFYNWYINDVYQSSDEAILSGCIQVFITFTFMFIGSFVALGTPQQSPVLLVIIRILIGSILIVAGFWNMLFLKKRGD